MARPKKTINDYRGRMVSATEAALFLGLPERSFYRLVERGVIQKQEDGTFLLGELAEAYYKSLYDSESLNAAKTRLTRAQAEKAELELAEEKDELHRATAVMSVWAENVINAKTKLLAIPSKMAPQLVGLSAAEVEAALKKEISEVLHELAEYDDRRIARASPSRRK